MATVFEHQATPAEGGTMNAVAERIHLSDAGGRTRMQTSKKSTAAPAEFDLGGFVRHVAHELANPLNAIMMNAEMANTLLARGDTARAAEALSRLLGDCTRSVKLMRSLQQFGAAVGAQAASEVGVRDLIEGAASSLVFEYEGAVPTFNIEAADAVVTVDRGAVERALGALLRNSAEANATAVQIEARREGNDIVIELRDDGNGIDEKVLHRMNNDWYSSKRAQGCLGLGIAFAREVVRKQNGSFELRANSPKGLIVSIRLPA